MYEPTLWQDEVVEYPYRYTETENADGTITHTPAPGETLKEGTPQSATNFNHMENGIFEAHQTSAENTRMIKSQGEKLDGIVGQTIEVTLTNTLEYPFNSSKTTVQLDPSLNTKDYTVTPEIVSVTGGAVGDIEITDKLLNGFKVAYTGSATEVVLKLYIRGGV